jgi:hypothetical protein
MKFEKFGSAVVLAVALLLTACGGGSGDSNASKVTARSALTNYSGKWKVVKASENGIDDPGSPVLGYVFAITGNKVEVFEPTGKKEAEGTLSGDVFTASTGETASLFANSPIQISFSGTYPSGDKYFYLLDKI